LVAIPGGLGTIVDQAEKKERRRKQTNAGKTMTQATGAQGASLSTEEGLSPNLQAHIGRHLRAVFDEVAREPIPDRLLQLLKDLERSGDK
jgi:Anti-sigma factor NepR